MEVFLWLILIWVVALCPPIGFIIGILALLGAAIGSCFRRQGGISWKIIMINGAERNYSMKLNG